MTQQILVIDDSLDIHQLLEARLRPEGVGLHRAMDAQEGLEKARELQPDLILLDIDLPGANGFEVCRQLKADPRTSALQVIFLSGSNDTVNKVQGFDLGAVDYVCKPFDAAELRARVRAALRTKRLLDLLAERAQIDGLTGIYNRAYLDQRLEQEAARARRYGSSFTVVLADLDHFKRVNDEYGHPFGDLVLQSFAGVLAMEVRNTDAACRYGGEEFALLLPETTVDGAMVLIGRIRDRMKNLDLRSRNQAVAVTASWGLIDTKHLGHMLPTGASLLELADQGLYEAKRSGRDCARVAQIRDTSLAG